MDESENQIQGVIVKPLKRIPDIRGTIMQGVRSDNILNEFGEVYFKKLYKNIINGWHVHETLILNYIGICGMIKVVLYDMRENSATKGKLYEIFMGDDNYVLVHVPTGIANASTVISGESAIMCNVASEPHDPNLKYTRIDPHDGQIPYDWNKRDY